MKWTCMQRLAKGQSLLVQETYDAAWRAYENGRPVSIRREPVMNFMLLDLPEGAHDIRMRFETPLENRLGQIAFVIGLGAVLLLVVSRRAPTPITRCSELST